MNDVKHTILVLKSHSYLPNIAFVAGVKMGGGEGGRGVRKERRKEEKKERGLGRQGRERLL